MIKHEFVKSLKKTDISENADKTKERVREIWWTLGSAVREEILTLAGLQLVSVQRVYKTGSISAKVAVAMGQVLDIDPLYLTGASDERGSYDVDAVMKMLISLGYDIGKRDIIKRRQPKDNAGQAIPTETTPEETEETAEEPTGGICEKPAAPCSCPAPAEGQSDLNAISAAMSKVLNSDASTTINSLSEDETILLLKSLGIQASFSADKRNRLALIKSLLLL